MERATSRAYPRATTAAAWSPEQVGRIAIVALVVATAAALIAGACVRPAAPSAASWTDVSVGQNGTLWELAQSHPVPGLSVSETVDLIRAENSLRSSTVYEGQSIRVPAMGDHTTTVASR